MKAEIIVGEMSGGGGLDVSNASGLAFYSSGNPTSVVEGKTYILSYQRGVSAGDIGITGGADILSEKTESDASYIKYVAIFKATASTITIKGSGVTAFKCQLD